MKKTVLLFIAFTFISCKKDEEAKPNDVDPNPIEIGKNLFEGKGTCTACHKPNAKIIGPSLVEISKIYKEKNASIVSFLKEESKPIVDPSQYEVMKTNFAITKTMTEEELKALEAYVLSF